MSRSIYAVDRGMESYKDKSKTLGVVFQNYVQGEPEGEAIDGDVGYSKKLYEDCQESQELRETVPRFRGKNESRMEGYLESKEFQGIKRKSRASALLTMKASDQQELFGRFMEKLDQQRHQRLQMHQQKCEQIELRRLENEIKREQIQLQLAENKRAKEEFHERIKTALRVGAFGNEKENRLLAMERSKMIKELAAQEFELKKKEQQAMREKNLMQKNPLMAYMKVAPIESQTEATNYRSTIKETDISKKDALKAKREQMQREREKAELERLEEEEQVREQYEKILLERKKREEEEKERKEKSRMEREKKEEEQKEQDLLRRKKLEEERQAREKRHQDELERERIQKENLLKERMERERLEKERLEQKRLENERLQKELAEEKARQEKERLEKLEQERLNLKTQELERENRLKEQREKERLEREAMEKKRLEREAEEKELLERKRLEQETLAKKKLEEQQLESERLEKERLEQERKRQKAKELEEEEKRCKEEEKARKDRLEEERKIKERQEKERLEQEKQAEIKNEKSKNNKPNSAPVKSNESSDFDFDSFDKSSGKNSKPASNDNMGNMLKALDSNSQQQIPASVKTPINIKDSSPIQSTSNVQQIGLNFTSNTTGKENQQSAKAVIPTINTEAEPEEKKPKRGGIRGLKDLANARNADDETVKVASKNNIGSVSDLGPSYKLENLFTTDIREGLVTAALEEHFMTIEDLNLYYPQTEFGYVKFVNLYNELISEQLVFFFDTSLTDLLVTDFKGSRVRLSASRKALLEVRQLLQGNPARFIHRLDELHRAPFRRVRRLFCSIRYCESDLLARDQ